jgi:uncharacterized repeat protein (TIGR01451 family)
MCRIGGAVRVLLAIALFGLPAGVQAEGDDDGLVVEWHFDEGSGGIVHDSSGNGNDGVVYGATWVKGKYGGALEFDGVDDYVEVPDSMSLDLTQETTVEIWIKSSNMNKRWPNIFNKGTPHDLSYTLRLYDVYAQPCFQIKTINGYIYARSSETLMNNKWYHLVGTYDGSSIKLFVDGNLNVEDSCSGNIVTNNHALVMGTASAERGYEYPGLIDEVRIYNRALTTEEIKQHYEGKQTAVSLTKSATPHSIKQSQTTTVTLTVTNTGTTEITDIEVADTIPTDLTFVDGETSKTYTSLGPKDSREFQYTIQLNEAGTFNLNPATATYSDEEGNYHTVESKTAVVTVIAYIPQTTPHTTKNPSADISTASVHLHGEKTDVVLGEDVLLKLSAVNIIGNPLMRVQVIIIPPSGWSVTSSEFAKSGAGQYTTTYNIKEGVGRDIEVRIMPNQIGNDFHVQGRIIYYFGDDSDAREDHTLTLPITVRAEAENGQGAERTSDTSGSEENGSSTPGFSAVVAVAGVLAVYLRRR